MVMLVAVQQQKKIFHYQIDDNFANVSGPSAGTAMTLLALSPLSHKKLLDNFTVTGVINYNGTIGEIGGVPLFVSNITAGACIVALPTKPAKEIVTISIGSIARSIARFCIPISLPSFFEHLKV